MMSLKKFSAASIVFLLMAFLAGCHRGESDSSLDNLNVQLAKVEPASQQERAAVNDAISQSRRTAITEAVKKVKDAVCGINVTQIREYVRSPFYFDDPFFRFFFPEEIYRKPVKSLGSGYLISSDGFILTNEHVVHNAEEIVVTLTDGSTHNAKIVGQDYISDIALLKIDGQGYPYIKLGDSDDVMIGEWVIALGNPFGLFEINAQPTVTVGVVSAVDRDFGRQPNDRVYQDMIQTDAAINQGNSGGPLVNSLGEVIGTNTFIYTGSEYNFGSIGLGFAIPTNRIKRVLKDLKQYGEVNRSWTSGLKVEDITPLVARYFRLKNPYGVIVTEVERNSPAAHAGLEVGDIIVEVNGHKVRSRSDILSIIEDEDLRGGDEIHLSVLRQGKKLQVTLKLEKLKE